MKKRLVEQFLTLLILLILSFLTLWIFRSFFNLQQNATSIVILLAPPLIYLIMSGKLLEINMGGVSAKFNATANESVFNEKPLEIREIEIAEKLNEDELQTFLHSISNSIFITLTVRLGKGEHFYKKQTLQYYLCELSRFQGYIFLVLLDQHNKVFAYLTNWQAMRIIARETKDDQVFPNNMDRFVKAINLGREDVLRGYDLITTTIKATDTNIFALKKMTELNLDALLITDKNGNLKGVVERAEVQSKLLLSIEK